MLHDPLRCSLIVCFAFTLLNLRAQNECTFAVDSLGSGNANMILDSRAIAKDAANNYYITGGGSIDTIFYGGETILVDSGSIFLIKFNEEHDIVWVRKGSDHEDAGQGQALAVDGEGNVFVGGYYEDVLTFGDDPLTNVEGGSQNSFITKFNSSGDHLWSTRIHTPGYLSTGSISSLATDQAGNVFFGGFFTDTIIVGTNTLASDGDHDNFWGKVDQDGSVLWARASGATSSEKGTSVATDEDGNVYVVGRVPAGWQSYFDTIPAYTGGFIAKYTPDGGMRWLRGSQSGSGFRFGQNMLERKVAVANGYVAVTGTISSNFGGDAIIAGAQTLFNHEISPAFALKLDTAGNGIWVRALLSHTASLAGSGCEGLAIDIDQNGNIVLLAQCFGPQTNYLIAVDEFVPTLNPAYPAPFVYLLDGGSGSILDQCHPAAPGGEPEHARWFPRSMTLLNDSIFATGSYYHHPDSIRRIFTMRPPLSLTVGVNAVIGIMEDLILYPNPGKDGFMISGNSQLTELVIYDAWGRIVQTEVFRQMDSAVHLIAGPGIYFVEVTSKDGMRRTFRWIKEE